MRKSFIKSDCIFDPAPDASQTLVRNNFSRECDYTMDEGEEEK